MCWKKNPLHIYQHAHQSGKSTDAALKSVDSTTEKALQTQEIALGGFLDIKGAFDSTLIEAITSALLRHGVLPLFERWIASMLSSICILSSFMGETMQVASVRGCRKVAFYRPCYGTWPWTNCCRIWMRLGITQLDLQMILLLSSEVNSQAQSLKYYKLC